MSARTFLNKTIASTGFAPGGTATVSLSLQPSYTLSAGTLISVVGLTGTAQTGNPSLITPSAGVLTVPGSSRSSRRC